MESVLGPVLVAGVTTLLGIIATWYTAKRLSRMGLGDAQLQVNKSLRELAETEKAKREIIEADYARDRDAWATEKVQLVMERDHYRREADDCDRRLNNAYSEMRETGRLTDRRRQPRPMPGIGSEEEPA